MTIPLHYGIPLLLNFEYILGIPVPVPLSLSISLPPLFRSRRRALFKLLATAKYVQFRMLLRESRDSGVRVFGVNVKVEQKCKTFSNYTFSANQRSQTDTQKF